MLATEHEQRDTTNEHAAALLVAASAVDFETDRGDTVEIWTIDHDGAIVSASGPRLAIARDMHLKSRVPIENGALLVHVVVDAAEYRSESRATLTLRVTEAALEHHERGAARLALHSPVTLRALTCGRIVPGEIIAATLHDLSRTGVGITTTDTRIRPADHLHLSARFVEGQLDFEVSVRHVAKTSQPGTSTVGCLIHQPNPTGETLVRVLDRLEGRTAAPIPPGPGG